MRIKRRRYIQFTLALMALIAVGATFLLNSPRVQQRLSVILATELENRIGTRVSLGGVRWLFPNDIVVDSLTIDDQDGEHLFSVSHIAAKVEWMPLLLDRQLSVRNVRLFYPDIHIYKPTAADDYNFQFLIDAFALKKERQKEPSRLSLRINTLLIRHAHICHRIGIGDGDGRTHCTDAAPPHFSAHNLAIDNLSAQLSLKMLSADSVSVIVRHLGFEERSGLRVDDLYLRLVANHHGATLANFQLDMPHSTLRLDTVWASYSADNFKESLVAKGGILPSHITPSDLAWLMPHTVGFTERVNLSARIIGNASRINVRDLHLHTQQGDMVLRSNATASFSGHRLHTSDIDLKELSLTTTAWELLEKGLPSLYAQIPAEIPRIGAFNASGRAKLSPAHSLIDMTAETDAGDLKAHIEMDGEGRYTTSIEGQEVDVRQIIPSSPLTTTNLTLETTGIYDHQSTDSILPLRGTFKGKATNTCLLGYCYRNIDLNGRYGPDSYGGRARLVDPNGTLTLHAEYNTSGAEPSYSLGMEADHLDLYAMNLIDIHEGNTFSTSVNAAVKGSDLNHLTGRISIDSLTLHKPDENYVVKQIVLNASESESKMLSLTSDFMHAYVTGLFHYSSLPSSLLRHLHRSFPSLCYTHSHDHDDDTKNYTHISAEIDDVSPLRELLLVPVDLVGRGDFKITVDDYADTLSLVGKVPRVDYNSTTLRDISFSTTSKELGVDLLAETTLSSKDNPAIDITLESWSVDTNRVNLDLHWGSKQKGVFDGNLRAQASLELNDDHRLGVGLFFNDARATINQSEWTLNPCGVAIDNESVSFDSLRLAGGTTQHLSIDGSIAKQSADTLKVDFTGIDLGYLLSLVRFEGISFGGKMSGHADVANLYSERPHIEADLKAKGFTFCNAPMGDLDGRIGWNNEKDELQFAANVCETPQHMTYINGSVDLQHNGLTIDIDADRLNAAFLGSMLGGFMSNVEGNVTGDLTIAGAANALDLDGALLADIGFDLTSTNVKYHLNDSLRFSEGLISLDNTRLTDKRGHTADVLQGRVTHNKLSDFAYDLTIKADNLLGIHLPEDGGGSFYTTIYATGDVRVKGSESEPLTVDIEASPEKGSTFALNLASQNVSSGESFIEIRDRSTQRNISTLRPVQDRRAARQRRARTESTSSAAPSAEINITAELTPDVSLLLVIDPTVNDHISVSGSGDLRIAIQGDDVNLFGTYNISQGSYRLNLQDLISKNFDVLSGSTVSFEGDLMASRLDITARHAVNYVPLKDLSPEMTGNVHVNCLLHIGGTLSAPTVNFSLELPKGTEEEKSMLASYTNTPEQMNLQFIYLLGLGKFYTADMEQNAEGTGNMQSFISSTISGQINNLLADIISNDNWNLASNIRAENMMTGENQLDGDNWENMEIEGILEGRLLDNRLFINSSFGYRENPMYATNFIGEFDIRYHLVGGLSLKGYNKTNDRYFSKTSLTTQGIGLVYQHDYDRLFPRRKRKEFTTEKLGPFVLPLRSR